MTTSEELRTPKTRPQIDVIREANDALADLWTWEGGELLATFPPRLVDHIDRAFTATQDALRGSPASPEAPTPAPTCTADHCARPWWHSGPHGPAPEAPTPASPPDHMENEIRRVLDAAADYLVSELGTPEAPEPAGPPEPPRLPAPDPRLIGEAAGDTRLWKRGRGVPAPPTEEAPE